MIFTTCGTLGTPSSLGGGPSTVIETMFSPLRSTRPSTLFSSLSADFADFGFSFLWRITRDKVTEINSYFCKLGIGVNLPELFTVAKNDIHVLVKCLELANEGAGIL